MKWLCLTTLMILSLTACGRSDEKAKETPSDKAVAVAMLNCKTGVEQPWSCLEQACSIVGGHIDRASRECICPSGKAFMGWNSPSCESRQVETDSTSFSLSNGNLEGATSRVTIRLPENTSTKTRLDVAHLSASHNFPLFMQGRWQSFRPATASIAPEMLERYLFVPPPPTISLKTKGEGDGLAIPEFTEIVNYSTDDELLSILRSTDYANAERDQAPASLSNAHLINAAIAAEDFSENVTSFTNIGCLGACEVKRKYSIPEYPDHHFEQVTLWSGGVPYRSFLNISQGGLLPIATIFQSPHGRPLMFAEYRQESETGRVSRFVKFTNTLGQEIGEHRFEIETTEVIGLSSASTADVLMCEPWYGETWKRPELKKHLVRGPLAADEPKLGASFWGWHASESETEFFSGYKPISLMGFFDYGELADPMVSVRHTHHFEEVLEQIVGEGTSGIRVAPMRTFECERHTMLRSDIQEPPRIINYSSIEYRATESCSASYPQLASTPFLWVAGAGNNALRDKERSQMSCPQNGIPRKRRIIVGAVDFKGNVESYSNQNGDYVDIYAPGKACRPGKICDKGTDGTSFASPRVAHVAAKIVKLYPELSNEQVRMAILLGADESYNLPALSRGLLREKESLAFAKSILETGSYEEAVKANYPRHWLRARAKKLEILTDILAQDASAQESVQKN